MKVLVFVSLCVALSGAFECGVRKVAPKLRRVVDGEQSYAGQWPWLVSLYGKVRWSPYDYNFCGATLINEWTVVTTARCVEWRQTTDLSALFGRFNLTDGTESHWVKRNISEIKRHENFNNRDRPFADSNIAILILEEAVKFTDYIQPICLPKPTDSSYNIEGLIAGYGGTERLIITQSTPLHATLQTISPSECVKTHEDAPSSVSLENSFCAKSNTCVPYIDDGGGPFMVEEDNIWTLFGIFSHAFNSECDLKDYAAFVDVTKFVDWILKNSKTIKIECGERKISKPSQLIINGTLAYHGEHPWLASLQVKLINGQFAHICGASIINEWSLVTAAHCVQAGRKIKAIFGRHDINNANEQHWAERNVSEVKIHQNYSNDAEYKKSNADIAVLILESPVNFTNYIRPICLPKPTENVFNVDGIVVGRGRTSLSSMKPSPTPLQAFLRSIDIVDCLFSHQDALIVVSRNSFCAMSEHQAPCQGDSGGPFLVHNRETSRWTLLGVVSYAVNSDCNPDDFTVFSSVPMFVDWILSNIKNSTGF